MAIYSFQCGTCGCGFDLSRPVDLRDSGAPCPDCGASSRRKFEPCAIRQPCKDFAKVTARTFLGPKSEKVIVTKGMPKPIVR